MPYATAGGSRVYYEVHGEGPVVVLVHGAGGHHAIWWQQIPQLRDRYTVIALDLPGFGNSDSDRDEYDAKEYPTAILAVLDHARIERAALVGQSLGCPPSLSVAVSHPERVAGVILGHSLGGIDHEQIMTMVRADRAEAEKLPVIDRLMSKDSQAAEAEKLFLFRQLGTFNVAQVPLLRNLWVGWTSLDAVTAAIAAGVYMCFLAGVDDAVVRPATYARLQELLPEAHYELVAGAPHSMYWEAPNTFNAVLERNLEMIFTPDLAHA